MDGTAGEAGGGAGGVPSAELKPLWVTYTERAQGVDADLKYAIRLDQGGVSEPILISPPAREEAYMDRTVWSPDGASAILERGDGYPKSEQYLIHFGEDGPIGPIPLTEDLPPSESDRVRWSASGETLLMQRKDGVYIVDYTAGEAVATVNLIGGAGFELVNTELVGDDHVWWFGRDKNNSKFSLWRSDRQGSTWTQTPVLSELAGDWLWLPAPLDAARSNKLTYASDTAELHTLFQLDLAAGAEPVKLLEPAPDLAMRVSPDSSQWLIARATAADASAVLAGPAAHPTQLATLAPSVLLHPGEILVGVTWAPDSSRAALWVDDPVGKKLVIYEPSAGQEWLPLALPAVPNNTSVYYAWSPSSTILAVFALEQPDDGDGRLTLVEFPSGATRVLDRPITGFGFGPDDQLAFDSQGESYLLGLQTGLAAAGNPLDLPGEDTQCRFGASSRGVICSNGLGLSRGCTYIDLSGPTPAKPLTVVTGDVRDCELQPVP
jgi:hypothetical protein